MLTAELGGRRRAQLIAAGAIGACPVFVGASLLYRQRPQQLLDLGSTVA